MKTVLAARAGLLSLSLKLGLGLGLGATAFAPALAQQTGGPPIPAAPRAGVASATTAAPAPVSPVTLAPAPAPDATVPEGEAAAVGPSSATTLSPAAAAAVSSATTRSPAPRNAQTSLLIEIESSQADVPVSVAIYRDAETFRKGENPVRRLTLNRDGPVTRAFVLNLPAGRYAITVWQDVDGDGKPTRTRFGGSTEPLGYSRGARARFGLPRFDDAAFEIGGSGVTQRIVLRGG